MAERSLLRQVTQFRVAFGAHVFLDHVHTLKFSSIFQARLNSLEASLPDIVQAESPPQGKIPDETDWVTMLSLQRCW